MESILNVRGPLGDEAGILAVDQRVAVLVGQLRPMMPLESP